MSDSLHTNDAGYVASDVPGTKRSARRCHERARDSGAAVRTADGTGQRLTLLRVVSETGATCGKCSFISAAHHWRPTPMFGVNATT
jgi:hypothetical protein